MASGIADKISESNDKLNLSISKMREFFTREGIIKVIVLFFLLFFITSTVIHGIVSNLRIVEYPVGVYNKQEFSDKLGHLESNTKSETVNTLIQNGAVFDYSSLGTLYMEDKYDMLDKNISNFSKGSLVFNEKIDPKTYSVINQLKRGFSKNGQKFNSFIFQEGVPIEIGDTNYVFFKDLFKFTDGRMSKISCLMKQGGESRKIKNDGICSSIGIYIAVKEYLLEKEDKNIAFPFSYGNDETKYIKKYDEGGSLTEEYNDFLTFLQTKGIINLYIKQGGMIFGDSYKGVISGIKQGYFFSTVFDGVFDDPLTSNKYRDSILFKILSQSDITEDGGNTNDNSGSDKPSKPKPAKPNNPNNSSKPGNNGSVNNKPINNNPGNTVPPLPSDPSGAGNVLDINNIGNNNSNNNGNSVNKINGRNNFPKLNQSTQPSDNSNNLIGDSLRLNQMNYELNKELVNGIYNGFVAYMEAYLNKNNEVGVFKGKCLLKTQIGYYGQYNLKNCNSIITMNKGIKKDKGEFLNTTNQLKVNRIEKSDFNLPYFGFGFTKFGAGLRVVGLKDINGESQLVLRKYYFNVNESTANGTVSYGKIIGIILVMFFLLVYVLFYNTFFILEFLQLGFTYIHFLGQKGISTSDGTFLNDEDNIDD